ncbi:Protein of unknown function [Thalassococcus halodurans]|uniref:Lysozyme inhibitor LprI-like N-terminal domain-containing protein n=1 Tax=Thalassococcus halodurans TaxID=373675 RepID=A0A1H5ZXE1_9RHOB|nr:lysozyme inhibitor LprI family protein [Thalassococcus halodurans]SEG41119.1 Protein of unknown function [Thalassococcus halodurans]
MKRASVLSVFLFGFCSQAYASDIAEDFYDKSYLQVEACFEIDPVQREQCVISGIQRCEKALEKVLFRNGLGSPGGGAVSPREYCNFIGLERADEHLNAVYNRILKQGPLIAHDETALPNLRSAQRLWLQFSSELCSEDNIVGWHAGGSGWGAVTAECTTRLSIQQAGHLERYFTISD